MSLAQLRALFQIGLISEPQIYTAEVDQGDHTILARIDNCPNMGLAQEVAEVRSGGQCVSLCLHRSMCDMMLRAKYRVEEQKRLDAIQVNARMFSRGREILQEV